MRKLLILLLTLCSTSFVMSRKPVKVACVGNSITFGTGIDKPKVNSYPAQLQRLLGDDYEVGRFGKPGATLLYRAFRPYVVQEEFKQAMAFAADVVVMHLGINDTDPRAWPNYRDEFVSNYLALMDSFRVANPKCRFLVAQMTPLSHRHYRFESGTRDWHEEIQQAIRIIAQKSGALLIDFHAPLYPNPHMLPDAIHPNAEGAGLMAQTVYGALTGDYGGLQVSSLFSDHMVLPHGRSLTLRGTANAGETVRLSIDGNTYRTEASALGQWEITLPPLTAGGPYTLEIKAKSRSLKFQNVMAGEVWLCSGQSNMEFMLKQSQTGSRDIPQAQSSQIRFFDMKARWRTDNVEWPADALDSLNLRKHYRPATWTECTQETAADFSAIAYYFGRMLQDSLKVPIGLICNAVGGSPTESWIDRRTLEYEFPTILRDWLRNDFIQPWVRERAQKNIKLSKSPLQRHPYEPCYLFESGILPLQKYPICGVIWYQGESNAHNADAHDRLFPLLVDSWRRNWDNAEMPFHFVQLSSINRPSWPWFRHRQQLLAAQIPHCEMAVSSDCGDPYDVHPRRKEEVGTRLARQALHHDYGFNHVTPCGPVFRSVTFGNGSALLTFDYGKGIKSSDGKELRTFEVAETDGLFHPATAIITPEGIQVSSPEVKNPRYVRYGWQPYTEANLVNEDGLPASTFRTP